jgi:predicted CXXCH cytochrome family protein
MCSTCHDPHGTDRTAGGSTWPALLRSYSLESTAPVFTGEAYCATCHTVQPGERWAGLAVYERTGHFSGIPMPGTGTGIRCSICHASHGSDVAPLLAASIVPTSVVSTFTVTADDRTFCSACHTGPSATWQDPATYATSAHALSSKTVTITARWVPAGQRKVGECQVCHAPMGRSDGAGGTIAKLLDAKGRILCDRCHVAGPGAVASTDTSSEARPVPQALTLAAVYAPSSGAAGRTLLYGRAHDGPGPLSGPRQYEPTSGVGPSAVGDVDGDGAAELVVASTTQPALTIYRADPLTGLGLEPVVCAIPGLAPAPAAEVAVANVVDALFQGARREIAVVGTDGTLSFFDLSGTSLLPVAGPFSVGAVGPWGLATGDVTGTPLPDAVVTDASGGTVYLVRDDGVHGAVSTPWAVGGAPVVPAVGDVWDALPSANEVVVCDAASVTDTVRVFDGSGTQLASYPLVAAGGGSPSAAAIGNVLPASGRSELAVAFTSVLTGSSSVFVIPQATPGPGLDTTAAVASEIVSGTGTHTGSLLAGDVDGDGRADLIAGDAGTWAPAGTSLAPDVRIWRANSAGTALGTTPETLSGGGTEVAGTAPSLLLADLGPVLPSRHPIDEVTAPSAQHVSTETAPVGRHVTCSDCHDSHEAVAAVTSAPAVQGVLRGAWGVVGATTARSTTSYGICFKCHSAFTDLGGRPDAAAQFDPANPSLHSVSQASTSSVPAATFVPASGFAGDSVLYCTDCHGDDGRSGAQARGLHESDSAPILASPYLASDPADAGTLCYSCHRFDVYGTGAQDAPGMSFFRTTGATPVRLHSSHGAATAGGRGIACSACHVSHGSTTLPHLVRDDIGFVPDPVLPHAGSCTNACHGGLSRSWPLP